MTKRTGEQFDIRESMDQPSIREARDCLRDYEDRTDNTLHPEYWHSLSEMKSEAVVSKDELTAKAIWCLETIGRIQDHFLSAFLHLKASEFEEAWYQLERCEIEISFLDGHFTEQRSEFGIEHIRTHTRQFQELYPFTIGLSPAFLKEEVRCSICHTKISLRSGCGHRVREIYNGEMAARVITKVKMLHVSIVDTPFQKYSVIFPNGNDDPRLKPFKELAYRLESPWRSWRFEKEERRDYHPAYRDVGRNERCPCGSSLKYKRCCLNNEKVFPHYSISILSERRPFRLPSQQE